jgi:hypothetical protein
VRSKISEASSGTLLCDIICAEAPLQPCRTATQSAGKYVPAGQSHKARANTTAYEMMTKNVIIPKLPLRKKKCVALLFKCAEIIEAASSAGE